MRLSRGSVSPPRVEFVARDGSVSCPVRGYVDVERCIDCPCLEDAQERNGSLVIQCRPRPSLVRDVELLANLGV